MDFTDGRSTSSSKFSSVVRERGGLSILIGIGGGTGSGKTTLAEEIASSFAPEEVAIIHQDSYYRSQDSLSPQERENFNYDHPLAFENSLLFEHLQRLLDHLPVEVPIYDYRNHRRKEETRRVGPVEVIIVEGLLVLDDERLRGLMDIKIFVDTDADIRLIRRILRDTKERGRTLESILAQYQATVRPMHLEFVEKSKRYADIIVPGGRNEIATDMIVARIKELQKTRRQHFSSSDEVVRVHSQF